MRTNHFTTPSGASIPLTELGFGTAPLGNLFAPLTEAQAQTVLASAWDAGLRYFDTAPLYGLGLSETRLNTFFRGKPRADFVVSTKVGRLLDVCPPQERTGIGKFFDCPSRKERYDYSYDGVLRSLELSLERLGLDAVEILFVHDIDVFNHGSEAARDSHVETLLAPKTGGIHALRRLRDEKVIKAYGAGINEWQVAQTLAERSDPDMFLLAGRYTLLEQHALDSFMPLCERRGIGIVIGGAYNSGILATGANPVSGAVPMYNYEPAPAAVRERVARIEAICAEHGTRLVEAALRFPLMHPAVVSVIPGAITPEQVALNLQTLAASIPDRLWASLKDQQLLHRAAPPIGTDERR